MEIDLQGALEDAVRQLGVANGKIAKLETALGDLVRVIRENNHAAANVVLSRAIKLLTSTDSGGGEHG